MKQKENSCYAIHDKKTAFTLSEVILTIGIIGIIAALTIPQLIQNSNNKELVASFLKSNNVLANAYKNAKAIDNIHKLGGDSFKQTFKKYVKTVDCEAHDICLQDGMLVDFECDENSCTSLVVNTNGYNKPNQAGKDKFKFIITQDAIIPDGEQESCGGLDCGMYTLTYHKIFDTLIPNCAKYNVNTGKCLICDDQYRTQEDGSCSYIDDMPTCATFKGEECTSCVTGYANAEDGCNTCDTDYTSFSDVCVSDNGGCIDEACTKKNFSGNTLYKVNNIVNGKTYYAFVAPFYVRSNNDGDEITGSPKRYTFANASSHCPAGTFIPDSSTLSKVLVSTWSEHHPQNGQDRAYSSSGYMSSTPSTYYSQTSYRNYYGGVFVSYSGSTYAYTGGTHPTICIGE